MAGRRLLPLVVFALALGASAGEAQQHRVRIYGVENGLPSAEIHDLAHDAEGRLWLASHSGIASYDGRDWKSHGIESGLSWADQIALRFDREGELWTLSARSPLQIYRRVGERFELRSTVATPVPGQHVGGGTFEVAGFEVAPQGQWLAVAAKRHGLWVQRGDAAWRHYPLGTLLGTEASISALAQLGDRLVVATSAGLLELGPDAELHRVAGLPAGPIWGLSREGPRLWLVGDGWIGHLQDGSFSLMAEGLSQLTTPVSQHFEVVADAAGGIYLGNSQGLLHFRGGSEELEWVRWSDKTPYVRALWVDREAVLWVVDGDSLVKLPNRRLTIFDQSDGLFGADVTAVLERRDGSFVLGHRGGMTLWQGNQRQARRLPLAAEGRPPERVRDLLEDPQGHLWIAGDTAGLLHLDLASGQITSYGARQGLEGSVSGVTLVGNQLWAGSDRGLFRLDHGKFSLLQPDLRIRRLIPAKEAGAFWVAAAEGLFRWNGAALEPFQGTGSPLQNVFAVAETDDGGLWVGTGQGLFCTAGTEKNLGPCSEPSITTPIFWLATRQQGEIEELWVGSDLGVWRYRSGGDLRRFTVNDGIAGPELHRAAGKVDAQGRVWIGTNRGLSRYDGRNENPPTFPTIRLLEVAGVTSTHPLDQPLLLSARDNDLIFRFRVISLLDEAHTQIRYRLAGLDGDWRQLPSALLQEARYYDVPVGSYHFELQAANADGRWSEIQRSAKLVVAKPFYQRPWFFGITFSAMLLAAYAVQSYFGQRSYSRRLEIEVADRLRDLRISEERYRQTFQGIDDGIVTTNSEGRVVLLNPRAQELTGWSAEKAVGRRVDEILRLERELSSPEATRVPLRLDELGASQTAILEPTQGERRLIEISAAPVRTGEDDSGAVFAFRDIRQRRQLEEELGRAQRLEAIGLLAGGIAHDFNNLLTVLFGNLSLMRDAGGLDEDALKNLVDAENALGRARDLTHQLLTFARGGAPVRKTAVIAEVIRESSSFALRGSRIRCDLDLAEDLAMVDIDAGQISQVLHNLLINASQAMPGGGVVRIRARNSEAPLGAAAKLPYVRIDVSDQGVGIPDELLPRIFDPYFSTKEEGRGLGLASAYSIVNRHDGLLTVRSQVGRGTTFSIFLPASSQIATPSPQRPPNPRPGSGRILVMDDDAIVRRTATALLERLGYEVAAVADGRQALDVYAEAMEQADPFRAVLMDLTVPGGMGGQAAVKRLRDLDPGVIAVVYSGYSNDPVLANFRAYGFAGRLSKPFRLQDLAEALEEALSAGPP